MKEPLYLEHGKQLFSRLESWDFWEIYLMILLHGWVSQGEKSGTYTVLLVRNCSNTPLVY